jgi:hypothetical protein
VDIERFRQAIMACCQRHPMSRARLARAHDGETSYQWNFSDNVDVDRWCRP